MDRGWYLLWVRDISFKLFRENVMRSIAVYGVIPVVGSLLLSGFAVDAGAVGTGNVSDVAAQSTVSVVASTVGTAVSSISQGDAGEGQPSDSQTEEGDAGDGQQDSGERDSKKKR